jgi:hypothetical protein
MPHCVKHFLVSALFLTIEFIVDSTVADLAAIATRFLTSRNNISQPQTKVQGGSNMTGTDFFLKNLNYQGRTAAAQCGLFTKKISPSHI